MTPRLLVVFAIAALSAPLMTGCLTGNNYPDQNARAFCGSVYACFDSEDIEDYFGYDDEA